MGDNPTAIGVIPNLSTFHPQIIHRYTALSPAPSDEKSGENALFVTLSSAGSAHAIWDKYQRTFMHRNE